MARVVLHSEMQEEELEALCRVLKIHFDAVESDTNRSIVGEVELNAIGRFLWGGKTLITNVGTMQARFGAALQ